MALSKNSILSVLSSEKAFLEEQFAVVQLGLFGSYSNNKQTETSDIDIAFEIKAGHPFTWEKKIQFENYLNERFHKKVDLVRLKYINPVVKFTMEQEVIYV
jgi:predicted nucleotidyltransferase